MKRTKSYIEPALFYPQQFAAYNVMQYSRCEAVVHDGLEVIWQPGGGDLVARDATSEVPPHVVNQASILADLHHLLLTVPLVPPHVAGVHALDVVPVHVQEQVPVRPLLLVRNPEDMKQLVHHHLVVLGHDE